VGWDCNKQDVLTTAGCQNREEQTFAKILDTTNLKSDNSFDSGLLLKPLIPAGIQ
jgi:hypothetical protein